ncbi:haloacid dehalogenase [Enterococcus florum]|uniref:Haloacid dehalogenase n=1 Tax=Enterococcus florum TaxID=2480627 RepID=A0A4P5PCB1_9ENTE|nr:HAD family hydrolase [Enterococcus florum]GCF95436.1 haloacid dehalogenase [Enterococcus florum]
MLETVVFDVDDTLYDQQQPFRRAVQKVLPFVSPNDLNALYIRYRVHSDENFNKVITEEWSLEYMRNFRTIQSLKDLNYPIIEESLALEFQAVYEKELDAINMHEEVRKTLDYLKEKEVPMGIITNGPTDHQYKKILQLNLLDWIDEENIIISQATGYEKPDPKIFQLAAKQFHLDPEKSLYVGDNYLNDVIGSKKAGWNALWFNHREKTVENAAKLQALELNAFQQLPTAIKQLF